jgi:hypothetical protein
MLSVAISSKDITTRELTNQNQMGAYTVPTKGQRTASRKISKRNIYTNGSLHCTRKISKRNIYTK